MIQPRLKYVATLSCNFLVFKETKTENYVKNDLKKYLSCVIGNFSNRSVAYLTDLSQKRHWPTLLIVLVEYNQPASV